MSDISLNDILIAARRESHRMRHNYIGVEHLFIAMLELDRGLTASILLEKGLQPDYVIDTIRRKLGKGSKQRLWVGMPHTPRCEMILVEARKLAMKGARAEANERDLLVALLRENDSFPLRILRRLGMDDIESLLHMAQTFSLSGEAPRPFVAVEYGKDFDQKQPLSNDCLLILRRLFPGYGYIRVDRYLTGGYSSAIVLVVTPLTVDRREEAAVVVKIDHADAIMDEAQRYETYVKTRLPPMTARLEDRPVAPEMTNLAGLKYTLITANGQVPRDLRTMYLYWDTKQFDIWLRNELFPTFGRSWWQQNRPYRFQVWQEYDWLLPPLLTLELVKDQPAPESTFILKIPLRRSRLDGIEYGDVVTIENFLVHKIDHAQNRIEIAAGHGTDSAQAFKVEVRGVNLEETTYFRGEVIESITGTVWKTREELLAQTLRTLEPDFDIDGDTIPITEFSPGRLPNPISQFETLLDNYVNGTLSTIHGDLHPGNIMIGPGESAFLIDFAHSRDGHTIFDWASLEISLLGDLIMSEYGDTWFAARNALRYYAAINDKTDKQQFDKLGTSPMSTLLPVRNIAHLLLDGSGWAQYFTAIVFCALRAMSWETMPLGGRRLMFLVAALALHDLSGRFHSTSESETPTPDETNTFATGRD